MTKIVAAAIRFQGKTYALGPPNRHHDVIRFIVAETDVHYIHGEHGFLDNHGRFLNRQDAMVVAREAGQLLATERILPQLYSENLW